MTRLVGTLDDKEVSILMDMSYKLTKKEEVDGHFLFPFIDYLS